MLSHRASAGCVAGQGRFSVVNEVAIRQFVKAALDPATKAELSCKAAMAAVEVAFLVPDVATADPLWYLSDELLLYQFMSGVLLSLLGSSWEDKGFCCLT